MSCSTHLPLSLSLRTDKPVDAEGLSLSGAAECVAFTMLAPGSGSEQRSKLALQWRQVSCEYGPSMGRGVCVYPAGLWLAV